MFDVRMTWLDSLSQDARDAARTLGRRPSGAATAVAMLGLGIGITTAMFTIVDALIIRPVPFHEPDQLAFVTWGTTAAVAQRSHRRSSVRGKTVPRLPAQSPRCRTQRWSM